jgi:hypothetical protein
VPIITLSSAWREQDVLEALALLRSSPALLAQDYDSLIRQMLELRNAGDLSGALPVLEAMLDSDNWFLRCNSALGLYQLGVAGRRVLLRRTRKADVAGRTASLVLPEKDVASALPGR